MLIRLGLDECYSTLESKKDDLQHLWRDFALCGKGCIFGVKAVGTAVRCDREVRLQHLSFSCSFFDRGVHSHLGVILLFVGWLCQSSAQAVHTVLFLCQGCTDATPPVKSPHRGDRAATPGEAPLLKRSTPLNHYFQP